MAFDAEVAAVVAALGDPPPWGDVTKKMALLLVVICNAGAGDALAGLMLSDNGETAFKNLTHFGLKPKDSSYSGLSHALSTPTGDARIDRVLKALDRCASAGGGSSRLDAMLALGDAGK